MAEPKHWVRFIEDAEARGTVTKFYRKGHEEEFRMDTVLRWERRNKVIRIDGPTDPELRRAWEAGKHRAAPAAAPQHDPQGGQTSEAPREGDSPDPGAVVIPADWETMGWFPLRNLAQSITGQRPANKEAAFDVINGELLRRAGATSGPAGGTSQGTGSAADAENGGAA